MDQTTFIIGGVIVIVFIILAFTIGTIVRDIATHTFYAKKALDHIWANYAPKVGKGFNVIVKLDDLATGAFTYKGRKYFTGKERWKEDYPPGRSSLAQVTFDKCLVDPASSNMLTHIYGAPTVSASLVFAVAEQKDTLEAMERSREESSGGASAMKMWKWMFICFGVLGVIMIVGVVFTIKTGMDISGFTETIGPGLQKIIENYGLTGGE